MIGLGRLDDLERTVASGAGERVMVTNLRKEKAPIELAAVTLDGHTRAFLKLQEGCDQFCTFCIVPFSRGTSRSVEPRRVIAALDDLHARGFKEVRSYGRASGRLRQRPRPAGRFGRPVRDDRRAMPDRAGADKLARPRRVERPDHRDNFAAARNSARICICRCSLATTKLCRGCDDVMSATIFAIGSNAFCAPGPTPLSVPI